MLPASFEHTTPIASPTSVQFTFGSRSFLAIASDRAIRFEVFTESDLNTLGIQLKLADPSTELNAETPNVIGFELPIPDYKVPGYSQPDDRNGDSFKQNVKQKVLAPF